MKKLSYFLAFLIIGSLSISCQKNEKTGKGPENPEEVGKYAFDIIKNLDDMTKETYISTLFTVEEIKAYGEKHADSLSDRAKADINGLTKENYEKRMERDYNKLKENAQKFNIDFSDITYGDYTFKTKEEDGFKGTLGILGFRHDGTAYSVRVSTFFTDNKYMPIKIFRIVKKKKE